MNTLLFADDAKVRLPSEFRKQLPKGWTLAKVKAAILATHPNLEPVLGMGLELMATESRNLVAALLRLIDGGIVALPMHDRLIAGDSKQDRVRAVMEETAKQVVGALGRRPQRSD